VASSARWPAWRQLRNVRKTMTSMFSISYDFNLLLIKTESEVPGDKI
jgi:hypothetical protein